MDKMLSEGLFKLYQSEWAVLIMAAPRKDYFPTLMRSVLRAEGYHKSRLLFDTEHGQKNWTRPIKPLLFLRYMQTAGTGMSR